MYGYSNSSCNNYSSSNEFIYPYSNDFVENSLVPTLQLDNLVVPNNEFDSVSSPTLMMKQELYNYTTSSGCSSYGSPTSITSYDTQPPNLIMQRSFSSHSLQKYMNGLQYHQQLTQFSGVLDDSSPVKKAFSTGDLEGINMVQQHHRSDSPLSNESSIIECMNAKACKYSPEEKREKIERYRSKRGQRNFSKKIKYVCRKTLADSRPRIRGRFAKNIDENEGQMIDDGWNNFTAVDQGNTEYDENWINFLDAFSANLVS